MAEPGEEELARRIYAAVISMRMGLSLAHAYSEYAKGQDMGEGWIEIARALTEMRPDAK